MQTHDCRLYVFSPLCPFLLPDLLTKVKKEVKPSHGHTESEIAMKMDVDLRIFGRITESPKGLDVPLVQSLQCTRRESIRAHFKPRLEWQILTYSHTTQQTQSKEHLLGTTCACYLIWRETVQIPNTIEPSQTERLKILSKNLSF